jgi:DNA-directed RNA polymerase specialized sigma24 family protein
MPAERALHPNAKAVAAPAVRAKIFAVLGKRIPPADADDIAQAAYVRLLMMPSLPDTEHALLGLVVTVVRGLVIDRHRADKRRREQHADGADVDAVAVEDGAPSAEEREEWRQMLAFVQVEVDAGRVPANALRWARGLAAGETVDAIAAHENRSPSAIKMRMKRLREHLRRRWPVYAGVAGPILLFVLWIGTGGREVGTGSPEAAAPGRMFRERQFRAKAQVECREGNYGACEEDLNIARRFDFGGEDQPEVKAMRAAIAAHKNAPDAAK